MTPATWKPKRSTKSVTKVIYFTILTAVTLTTPVALLAKGAKMNNTTKKYPRTLREAFPDAPEPNFEKEGLDKEDVIVIVGCVCVTLFLIVLVIGGWL